MKSEKKVKTIEADFLHKPRSFWSVVLMKKAKNNKDLYEMLDAMRTSILVLRPMLKCTT